MSNSEVSGSEAKLGILLVEDNPCDVVLFKQILRKSSLACSLTVVSDGTNAVERLQKGFLPNAVFLDLNLPGKSGTEILVEIKKDPALASIPVAILTGSADPADEQVCNFLGVDHYFNKAVSLTEFLLLSSKIVAFVESLGQRPALAPVPELAATSVA